MERLEDGLGQSILMDVVWFFRFRACSRRKAAWRAPSQDDLAVWTRDARVERLGDVLFAAADMDGRTWLVIERFWHGWPDPPEFAFVAVEQDGSIWAARDFNRWPKHWMKPENKA